MSLGDTATHPRAQGRDRGARGRRRRRGRRGRGGRAGGEARRREDRQGQEEGPRREAEDRGGGVLGREGRAGARAGDDLIGAGGAPAVGGRVVRACRRAARRAASARPSRACSSRGTWSILVGRPRGGQDVPRRARSRGPSASRATVASPTFALVQEYETAAGAARPRGPLPAARRGPRRAEVARLGPARAAPRGGHRARRVGRGRGRGARRRAGGGRARWPSRRARATGARSRRSRARARVISSDGRWRADAGRWASSWRWASSPGSWRSAWRARRGRRGTAHAPTRSPNVRRDARRDLRASSRSRRGSTSARRDGALNRELDLALVVDGDDAARSPSTATSCASTPDGLRATVPVTHRRHDPRRDARDARRSGARRASRST